MVTGSESQKRASIERWNKADKHCPFCDARIPYEKRTNTFCSHSHSASFSNFGRKREGAKCNQIRHCLQCEKRLKVSQEKYCSLKCMKEFIREEYIERWLAGEETGIVGNGISTRIKNYLVELCDERCEICGWGEINPYSGKVPIELHHKNGNWEYNRPENLQILCPNCHSLTSTYKNMHNSSTRIR